MAFEDVTSLAIELRRGCGLQLRDVPSTIRDFVGRYKSGNPQQLTLRLVQARTLHPNFVIQGGEGRALTYAVPGRFRFFWQTLGAPTVGCG